MAARTEPSSCNVQTPSQQRHRMNGDPAYARTQVNFVQAHRLPESQTDSYTSTTSASSPRSLQHLHSPVCDKRAPEGEASPLTNLTMSQPSPSWMNGEKYEFATPDRVSSSTLARLVKVQPATPKMSLRSLKEGETIVLSEKAKKNVRPSPEKYIPPHLRLQTPPSKIMDATSTKTIGDQTYVPTYHRTEQSASDGKMEDHSACCSGKDRPTPAADSSTKAPHCRACDYNEPIQSQMANSLPPRNGHRVRRHRRKKISPVYASQELGKKPWADSPEVWSPAPIGSDWECRKRFVEDKEDKEERLKSFTDKVQAMADKVPALDTSNPDFAAGKIVTMRKHFPKELEPEYPCKNALGRPLNADRTANDAAEELVQKLASVAGLNGQDNDDEPKESKEERQARKQKQRELRKQFNELIENPPAFNEEYAPETPIYIRVVEHGDAPMITALYNEHVQRSTAVATLTPDPEVFWEDQIQRSIDKNMPFLVAITMGGKMRKSKAIRRLKREHLVGFCRAYEWGDGDDAFCVTAQMETFVQYGSFCKGIGRSLFDRVLAAISPAYQLKAAAPFLHDRDQHLWDHGDVKTLKSILISVPHADGEEDYEWKGKWLEKQEFRKIASLPNVGFKFGKPLNLDQYYHDTYRNLRTFG